MEGNCIPTTIKKKQPIDTSWNVLMENERKRKSFEKNEKQCCALSIPLSG